MVTSSHAISRLVDRLEGLVTVHEVTSAVNKVGQFKVGKTWVFVKDLGSSRTLNVRSTNGSLVCGSIVWAIVRRSCYSDNGSVATVLLAGRNKALEPGAFYVR